MAPRSCDRMPGPPPPASSAAAAASWATWKAERFCVERLNSTRASTSSWGSGGSEEKVIFGAETRPSTVTIAVTSVGLGLGDEVDLRVEVADQLQRALVELDALAEHDQPAAAQVELADRLDVGGGALDAERAAELDVEAAAAHEDLVRRVDPHVEADARAAPARAAAAASPTRARSRVTCTGGGVATWVTCSSAACEAPRPSAIEISVRPRSMRAGEQAAAADQRPGHRQRRRRGGC